VVGDEAEARAEGVHDPRHGRDDFRACGVRTDVDNLCACAKGPGLRRGTVVVRDRTVGEQNSCQNHDDLSSRKRRAKRFVAAVRGRWEIEHC
jgi:hypothetical protein